MSCARYDCAMRIGQQFATMACLAALGAASVAAMALQETQPDRRMASDRRRQPREVRELVQSLVAEAVEIQRGDRTLSEKPDVVSRTLSELDLAIIGQSLVERIHREPFVDAYVRWQLSSFDPPLPEMDDRAFGMFMDRAPPLIENPRAAQETVAVFRRAEQAGPLRESDTKKLHDLTLELDLQTATVEAMNRPALEFRDWVQSKLGERGPRRCEWLLERCAATVRAGWSARAAKTEITQRFGEAAADQTLTKPEKELIAQRTRMLDGLQREFVNEINFMADGSARISFSRTAVDDKDVRKWLDRLAGRDEESEEQ